MYADLIAFRNYSPAYFVEINSQTYVIYTVVLYQQYFPRDTRKSVISLFASADSYDFDSVINNRLVYFNIIKFLTLFDVKLFS